jgi:hypothetical protein
MAYQGQAGVPHGGTLPGQHYIEWFHTLLAQEAGFTLFKTRPHSIWMNEGYPVSLFSRSLAQPLVGMIIMAPDCNNSNIHGS